MEERKAKVDFLPGYISSLSGISWFGLILTSQGPLPILCSGLIHSFVPRITPAIAVWIVGSDVLLVWINQIQGKHPTLCPTVLIFQLVYIHFQISHATI